MCGSVILVKLCVGVLRRFFTLLNCLIKNINYLILMSFGSQRGEVRFLEGRIYGSQRGEAWFPEGRKLHMGYPQGRM